MIRKQKLLMYRVLDNEKKITNAHLSYRKEACYLNRSTIMSNGIEVYFFLFLFNNVYCLYIEVVVNKKNKECHIG